MKKLLFLGLILGSTSLFAQKVTIIGQTMMEDVEVLINKNDKTIQTANSTGDKGKFKMAPLESGSVYFVHFQKKGYITKIIEVDLTTGTLNEDVDLQLALGMEKPEEYTSTEVFKDPITRAYIDAAGLLIYDMAYSKKQRQEAVKYSAKPKPGSATIINSK